MNTDGRKTIFLTGGAGVLGKALIPRLTDVNLICLVHKSPIEAPNVETIYGDITQPRFGLSPQEFAELGKRIDYVVHSAAITTFGLTKEVTYRTNVEGTRNALGLADQANVSFCHISTAFAHLESLDPTHKSNVYEASKLEAEAVVKASGIPNVILRPSIVIGDSNDGTMARFQGFHFLCELMMRGMVPVWIPTSPDAYMDFIPQDVVADAVWAMVNRNEARGEYWITAGPRALQMDAAVSVWEQHIPRLTGRPIKRPRYVDADVIDRFVRPVFLPSLPARTQSMINEVLELLSFCMMNPLPTSLPELEAKFGVPHMINPELAVIRNAEYWAAKRGYLADPVGANRREQAI